MEFQAMGTAWECLIAHLYNTGAARMAELCDQKKCDGDKIIKEMLSKGKSMSGKGPKWYCKGCWYWSLSILREK